MSEIFKRFEDSVKARNLETQSVRLVIRWHEDFDIAPVGLRPGNVGALLRRGLGKFAPNEVKYSGQKPNLREIWIDFASGLSVYVYDESSLE